MPPEPEANQAAQLVALFCTHHFPADGLIRDTAASGF